MAAADLREELNCSLCLSIYKDPVTLPCGHNFCLDCIDPVLKSQDRNGVYICPNCREHLPERPALKKNSNLSNIAQRFQSLPPAEDNVCAFCLPDEVPAVICCQHCEAFLCDRHLRFHSKSPKHVFAESTTFPENTRCSVHKKPLEYFCSVDSACLCVLCKQDCELRGHDLQSLDDAAKSKKQTFRNIYDKLSSKRERAEEKIQSLKWCDKKINANATGITRRFKTMHMDMMEQLKVLFNSVLSEVSRQKEQMSLTLIDLIKHLEIEKDELYSKMDHIEQLLTVIDPAMVIEESKRHYFCKEDEEEDDEYDKEPYDMRDLDESLISQKLHAGLSNVMKVAQEVKDWREYTDLLLDVDTAANYLHVSEDLKTVFWSEENGNRPETPQRFQSFQVLSIKSFSSGRHYWEVEMSKSVGWAVGMCYPSIERKGDLSVIGANSKSWSLWGFNNKFFLRHDGKQTVVPSQNSSSQSGSCRRLRIDLDYEAGQLSFSERDDSVRLLHTFTAKFTEPLNAAFWVSGNKNQENCVVTIKRCKKEK